MLYPQQNELREARDLSGLWQFALDREDLGEREGWFGGLPDARAIAVPASWNEQIPEARDFLGPAWYERELWLPRSDA